MRILFIGDITGEAGRKIIREELDSLKGKYSSDLVIANVDNAAHGLGITPKIVTELNNAGIDVMTGGNHLFDRKEMLPCLDEYPNLLRGYNYPSEVPGYSVFRGDIDGNSFLVATFIGRTFMSGYDSPFTSLDNLIEESKDDVKVRIIDFHAEASSEKLAFGRYADGRVSAVLGTHTHVQTADEQLLPGGTAFITDVGMTGPHDGVIGMATETVLPRFLTGLPTRFEPAKGLIRLHAVSVEIDDATGLASAIERIRVDRDMESG